jgi:hypothetical protein
VKAFFRNLPWMCATAMLVIAVHDLVTHHERRGVFLLVSALGNWAIGYRWHREWEREERS